jgi:predicted dehydrogenase
LIGVDPQYNVIVEHKYGTKTFYETGKMQSNEQGGQSHSGVIDSFIDGIISGNGHEINGQEAIKSLEVVFAGMLSAETGQKVAIQMV